MIDLSFYLPELILLISLSFIILLDLFLPDDKKVISYYLIQASLIPVSYTHLTLPTKA